MTAFEQLQKKYSKQMNVAAQSCEMLPEHVLPMIQVTDKKTGEILTNIFNFVDMAGGAQNINTESLERFLMMRGILEPTEKLSGKDAEVYYLANMSSYLDEEHNIDDAAVENMNKQLGTLGESITQITFEEKKQTTIDMGRDQSAMSRSIAELEGKSNPLKVAMLDAFRQISDPFGVEISGETGAGVRDLDGKLSFDYEANPAEPSRPQKEIKIASYESLW